MWCIHTAVLTQPLLGKYCIILSDRSDLHMTDSLSIAVHVCVSRVLKLLNHCTDSTLIGISECHCNALLILKTATAQKW